MSTSITDRSWKYILVRCILWCAFCVVWLLAWWVFGAYVVEGDGALFFAIVGVLPAQLTILGLILGAPIMGIIYVTRFLSRGRKREDGIK